MRFCTLSSFSMYLLTSLNGLALTLVNGTNVCRANLSGISIMAVMLYVLKCTNGCSLCSGSIISRHGVHIPLPFAVSFFVLHPGLRHFTNLRPMYGVGSCMFTRRMRELWLGMLCPKQV